MTNSDGYYDTQCPECAKEGFDTKEDNLRVYDSGVAFCYVRHGYVKNVLKSCDKKQEEKEGVF